MNTSEQTILHEARGGNRHSANLHNTLEDRRSPPSERSPATAAATMAAATQMNPPLLDVACAGVCFTDGVLLLGSALSTSEQTVFNASVAPREL